jgi:hypothetical protein
MRGLGKAFGIVHVFSSSQTAIHQLARQIDNLYLCVLRSRIGKVFSRKFAEAKLLFQLSQQNDHVVRGDAGIQEDDLERSVEGKLKESLL